MNNNQQWAARSAFVYDKEIASLSLFTRRRFDKRLSGSVSLTELLGRSKKNGNSSGTQAADELPRARTDSMLFYGRVLFAASTQPAKVCTFHRPAALETLKPRKVCKRHKSFARWLLWCECKSRQSSRHCHSIARLVAFSSTTRQSPMEPEPK